MRGRFVSAEYKESPPKAPPRSEEHTSELQSQSNLVCRLLLEKNNEHTRGLARRIARLPLEQLQMLKWALNDTARQIYAPAASRMLGSLFDGVARHKQEGLDFL